MKENLKNVQTPGARCRLYRKKANMTQAQLAEAIHCSVDLVSAIERGHRTLTIENAAAMSAIFGIRKECLLCFDNIETDAEKRAMPFVERVVALQVEKDAFRLYAGLYGCNIVLIDNSKYKSMTLDNFTEKSDQERADIILDISNNLDLYYYSFQNKDGDELGRCNANEYNEIVKEVSEFAEFKIKKLLKGRHNHG